MKGKIIDVNSEHIEKAKKIILSYIDRYEYVNKSVRYDENGYKATLEKHIEAFNTVIGELHAMQNLLDEKNEEIEHLQKENEALRKLADHLEHLISYKYKNKDKIKDCLEDIEDYFENVSVPKEDIEFIKEKRNDLLKEE